VYEYPRTSRWRLSVAAAVWQPVQLKEVTLPVVWQALQSTA